MTFIIHEGMYVHIVDYTVDFTCIKTLIAGKLIKNPGQCWVIQFIPLLWMLLEKSVQCTCICGQ